MSKIEEIIEGIPYFIMRVTENFTLNNLVYYGDYIIDSVYDINKFLINDELNFFKCCQYQEGKKSNSKSNFNHN